LYLGTEGRLVMRRGEWIGREEIIQGGQEIKRFPPMIGG
jgi:hypothetical protein